jgi:hydroxyacylglutathione hydrolase
MIFRQLLHEPLAAASYLIGCTASGAAAVIDPGLPAERYALLAAERGLRIAVILETHMHADYLSTGRALAAITGAPISLSRLAEASFPHRPLDDGDCVSVGNLTLQALHTPGHTPEHTAYLLTDRPRADAPWCVFTGDCLFVGDVGRTDLVDLPLSGPAYQWRSLQRLLELPDYVEIYPGHYGGSACGGKSMSGKIGSTIGFERRFNWALQLPDADAFATALGAEARRAVESVLLHRNTNRGALPLPDSYWTPETNEPASGQAVAALAPQAALAAVRAGATPVDVRAPEAFAAGHLPGALHIPFDRRLLPHRVAALTAPGDPLLLLADAGVVARAAAAALASSGRNPVAGYLDAPPQAWREAGLPSEPLPTIGLAELDARLAAGAALLDVRDPYEWDQGAIPGALLIRLHDLRERLGELPGGRAILAICESGSRASTAASLLRRHGFPAARVAPEGVSTYLKQAAARGA